MIPRKLVYTVCLLLAIISLTGCVEEKDLSTMPDNPHNYWHKELDFDLGAKAVVLENGTSLVISRGRGENIKGGLYQKTSDSWTTIDSFDYSDYPQLTNIDSTFYYIFHETHHGFYKPRMFKIKTGRKNEIILPKVMWDETDYVMWRGMSVLNENNIWLAGQQGNIIHFDGTSWKREKNPAENLDGSDLSKGDLTSIKMISGNLGYAVGKDGLILRYKEGVWEKLDGKTNKYLYSVDADKNGNGWIVGEKGVIIRIENNSLSDYSLDEPVELSSVKIFNDSSAVAVGNKASLLNFNDGMWRRDSSTTGISDDFSDVEIISSNGKRNTLLIVGLEGVYSNSEELGFSFTKITTQANIKNIGNAGIFFQQRNELPSLLVENEVSPVILYNNEGSNTFVEKLLPLIGSANSNTPAKSCIADFNNDGYKDIILIYSESIFYFFLGQPDGSYKDVTISSGLSFESIDQITKLTLAAADFNSDGFLDLYVSNHNSRDYLFEGNGTGNFYERYSSSGIDKVLGYEAYGVSTADFNNDNLPDIFIIYKQKVGERNSDLFINKGNFLFEKKIDAAFTTAESPLTYSSLTADFNSDGNIDILVFSNRVPPAIYLNDGSANFKEASSEFGLNKTIYHPDPSTGVVGSADINNDGFIDLFISSKLYLNINGERFEEASGSAGINFIGNPSFADIDFDGDIDLFVGSSTLSLGRGERAVLFRNNLNSSNHVFIELVADRSNRDAIGAKIFIKSHNKTGEVTNKILYEIGSGNSPAAQNNLLVHSIGLPESDSISAEIIFPNGTTKTIEKLEKQVKYKIYESGIILNKIILAFKSIERAIKSINIFYETLRIFALFLLSGLLLFLLKKINKQNLKTGIALTIIVIFFLVLIHFFHDYSRIVHVLIPIIIPALGFTVLTYTYSSFKEIRERRYISHFKVESLIGEGGMGKVYKVVDIHTKEIMALKVLHPQLMNDPDNKKRLSSEGQLLSSFNHPNIIKVSEVGETKDYSFIAMDYLPNGTLQTYIENNFPLAQVEIKRILLQICEGLSAIHNQNVIHRDLKAANIMFDKEMNVKIMDFGLSKSPLVSQMTSLGTVIGTLGYVAPEQVTNIDVDERTDIFSLGVVMYQMMTKTLPFKGENEIALIHSIFNTIPENPSVINKNVLKEQDSIVLKAIAKDPNDRYTNCEILKLDIEKYF